jgi:multiple sugar transport system substrate-binding protein
MLAGVVAVSLGLWLGGSVNAVQAQTTVTFWSFLDPTKASPRELALKEIIDNFERANPDVKVKVEPQVWTELTSKFLLSHQTNRAPDLVITNTSGLGRIIMSGGFADLGPMFASKLPADQVNDFVQMGWNAGLQDGKRQAVPLFMASTSILYRRDLFKAAGVDPDAIRTWDDLTAAAQKVTIRSGDRVDVWGFGTALTTERVGGTTAISSMLQSGPTPPWNAETCAANYATPIGVRMIETHVDWINKHKVMPQGVIATTAEDLLDQFVAGRYAMMVAATARVDAVRKMVKFGGENVGVLRWPTWTADQSSPQQVQGFWIGVWSKSRNTQAAARFVEFVTSPSAVRSMAVIGGQVPQRLSVLNDPELKKPDYDFMPGVAAGWRDGGFILPTRCNMATFDADLNTAVQRVLVGAMQPMAALREAEASFRAGQR